MRDEKAELGALKNIVINENAYLIIDPKENSITKSHVYRSLINLFKPKIKEA
jgi:hypothetical protein